MQAITTIGLDIAKSVFQVHGIDAAGNVVVASLELTTHRADLLPEAAALPGRYRSLRLVASLVARTPGDWPFCPSDAAGLCEAVCEAA